MSVSDFWSPKAGTTSDIRVKRLLSASAGCSREFSFQSHQKYHSPQTLHLKRPDLQLSLFQLKKESKCDATWKSYSYAFARFDRWCRANDVSSLPTHPSVVQYFLTDLAISAKSVSAVRVACAAIAAFHLQHNLPDPCNTPDLKLLLRGIQKRFGSPPTQKQILSREQYRTFLMTCLGPSLKIGSLRDFRTAWIELILLHTSCRWGDLRELKTQNFTFSGTDMKIVFLKRKNDQCHEGHTVFTQRRTTKYCPVRLTQRYFSLLSYVAKSPYHGYVIPTIKGSGSQISIQGESKASYKSCRDSQKTVLTQMGLNPAIFGLHSGRISSNVFLKDAGFSHSDITSRVGWSANSKMPSHYAKKVRKITNEMDDCLAL